MVTLPTVAIANADGSDFIIINRSDFDPEIHIFWEKSAEVGPDQSEVAKSDEPLVIPDELLEPEFVAQHKIEERAQNLAKEHNMSALKKMAKELGISGYSRMDQTTITQAIAEAEADAEATLNDD